MDDVKDLDPNIPISDAVQLVVTNLDNGNMYSATSIVNFLCMQYRPESDNYRRGFIEANITERIFPWCVSVTHEKEIFVACRAVRALAGSPRSPDLVERVVQHVDVHLVNFLIDCLRKDEEYAADTVEQIIGGLMNTMRSSQRVRSLFLHANGLPILSGILKHRKIQEHPRCSLFTSYAILSVTRDIGNHEAFRQGSVMADVKRLLQHADLQVRAVCMMILANLAQSFDDPADDVSLDVQGVRFVVETLQETLHPVPDKYYGWRVGELVHALFSISAADMFKGFLVDAHAIPVLLEILETPAQKDHWNLAIHALHNLCFHSNSEERARNSLALIEDETFSRLKRLAHSDGADVVKNCAVLLADLSDLQSIQQPLAARSQTGAIKTVAETGEDSEEEKFDVMLSYAWASQRVVLVIRDKLVAAGLKVWIDVEFMGHNLIDSMASAVENSTVIIICCSSAYKASPNCRREADYAAHLRKPTIIANMEDGYVPRGWLGLHVAGKIWCDFREETPIRFERGFNTLLKQLAELGVALSAVSGMVKRVDSLGGALTPKVSKQAILEPVQSPTAASKPDLPAPGGSTSRETSTGSVPAGSALLSPTPAMALQTSSVPPIMAKPLLTSTLRVPSSSAVPPATVTREFSVTDGAASVFELLSRYGHSALVSTLIKANVTTLTLSGLRSLLDKDPSGFHDLVQKHFYVSFADSLALSASLLQTSLP